MIPMIRSAASKVMWVGRATVFLVGLAVILALVVGVASTAFGANGNPFLLGKNNVATAVSTLVKRGAGPALKLQVGSGPPLAVNSSKKVANLNADRLDSLDSPSFAGSGNSVYTGGTTFCSSNQVSTIPISVTRRSRLYASAHGDVVANGNANASTIMNIELRNGANTTTLARTGFGSNVLSANAVDIRPLEAEGVLKSDISTPSEAPFVLTPGNNYVLRLMVSLNGGTCTGSAPYLWDSSLSYILLGTP